MQSYFPYSHIINILCKGNKETTVRHTYFGEWQVTEEKESKPEPSGNTISELYY